MTKSRILVVDDDQRLRELLLRYLGGQDFMVITAENTKTADELLRRFMFDIVVLDVMMPGEDGITYARRLKKSRPDLPVLMLTAKTELDDRILGLESGVDDYVSKPFEPRELLLRIQAILRRSQPTIAEDVKSSKIGLYNFDMAKRRLYSDTDDNAIVLTESETALLKLLIDHRGKILTRQFLAENLDLDANERTIDVQITRLRKKIESDPGSPVFLQTVRGKGYVLKG